MEGKTTREELQNFLQGTGLRSDDARQLLGTELAHSHLPRLRPLPSEASIALGGQAEFDPEGRPKNTTLVLSSMTGRGILTEQALLAQRLIHESSLPGEAPEVRVRFATKYIPSEGAGMDYGRAYAQWGSLARYWFPDGLRPGFFGLLVEYVGDKQAMQGQNIPPLRLETVSLLRHGAGPQFRREIREYHENLRRLRDQHNRTELDVVNIIPHWHDLHRFLRPEEAGLMFDRAQLSTPDRPFKFGEATLSHARLVLEQVDDRNLVKITALSRRGGRSDHSPLTFTLPITTGTR